MVQSESEQEEVDGEQGEAEGGEDVQVKLSSPESEPEETEEPF